MDVPVKLLSDDARAAEDDKIDFLNVAVNVLVNYILKTTNILDHDVN